MKSFFIEIIRIFSSHQSQPKSHIAKQLHEDAQKLNVKAGKCIDRCNLYDALKHYQKALLAYRNMNEQDQIFYQKYIDHIESQIKLLNSFSGISGFPFSDIP